MCCLCNYICIYIFSDKDDKRRPRLTALSLILFLWDVKEPMTLLEKSRGRRTRCHGLSDLCLSLVWGGLKWQQCAPIYADVRSHLSGFSAIVRHIRALTWIMRHISVYKYHIIIIIIIIRTVSNARDPWAVCRGGTKVIIVPLDKLPLGVRESVKINQPEK